MEVHFTSWIKILKRPFFQQLAAQGHVVMDVAYRLFPETDIMGMVNDAKRAIAWLKENARKYGVDPDRIIISGGSAGGHLATLTSQWQPMFMLAARPPCSYVANTTSWRR